MCYISVRPGDSLTDTLQQVCEQMRFHKTGNTVLKPTLLLRLIVRFMPYVLLKHFFLDFISLPLFTFTNAGILDRSMFCYDNLPIKDAYLAPGLSSAPRLLFNTATFDNRCTLGCNFYGSRSDENMVRTLLEHIAAETETLTNNNLKKGRQA
jgi:NRPS condensation-like uncharacterized protein